VRILGRIGLGLVLLAGTAFAAVELSPWPAALLIRWAFDTGGRRTDRLLAQRVPVGIAAQLNVSYDPSDSDARLDVFYPDGAGVLPTIVWIHGGGFLGGGKEQVGNYARILAAGGYTVAAVDYSLAPGSTYPTPLLQLNRALAFLQHDAARLHTDAAHMVLAGDSAGAQLAAQLANIITSPDYARLVGIAPRIAASDLRGVLLYCGPYAMTAGGTGPLAAWFARTLQWSYSGRRDYARDPLAATLLVSNFLTAQFPPTFISVGNADALAPQSYLLANALAGRGVRVDALFYPASHRPALPHEYQFDLDTEEGRQALQRSLAFLRALH
jgi:acetyl esterase